MQTLCQLGHQRWAYLDRCTAIWRWPEEQGNPESGFIWIYGFQLRKNGGIPRPVDSQWIAGRQAPSLWQGQKSPWHQIIVVPWCDRCKAKFRNFLNMLNMWHHVTSCDRFHLTKQGVLNAFVSNESCQSASLCLWNQGEHYRHHLIQTLRCEPPSLGWLCGFRFHGFECAGARDLRRSSVSGAVRIHTCLGTFRNG